MPPHPGKSLDSQCLSISQIQFHRLADKHHDGTNAPVNSNISTSNSGTAITLVPKHTKLTDAKRLVVCMRVQTLEAVANLGQGFGKMKLETNSLLVAGHTDCDGEDNVVGIGGSQLGGRVMVGAGRLSSVEKTGGVLVFW